MRLLSLTRNTALRVIAAVVSAACLALFAYVISGYYVSQLMRGDAEVRSQSWTANLIANVSDLPAIIDGDTPSDESVMFLEQARAIGNIWLFRIYGPDGRLLLSSSSIGRTHTYSVNINDVQPGALAEIARQGIFVATRQRANKHEPEYVSESIAPIVFENRTIGYLGLSVDETKRHNIGVATSTQFAEIVVAIVLAAFCFPAFGLLRKTREKEIADDRLKYLAYHDTLTGVKNRHAISQFLDEAVQKQEGGGVAVHMVDLDNFKAINDTMGHGAGDVYLRELSSRLALLCDGRGNLGRVGGDEFLIVQTGTSGREDAAVFAAGIVKELAKPTFINGIKTDSGASVGTALLPEDGQLADDLIKSADIALYAAKKDGRKCHRMFKPEYDEKLRRRREVESSLKTALESGGLSLSYQPLLNLRSGAIESVEALLRFTDSKLGPVSPLEFIPIAEEAGLIDDIGDWVIMEGCRALSLLPTEIRLAINLSPAQFGKGNLSATIANAITSWQIDPARLEIEITENLLMQDSKDVHDQIDSIKALGCSLALDDFGAGYSSLNYLWRYPFDKIKIDRQFIASLKGNRDVQDIVEVIVLLAKKLKMRVTAEGVETEEQAALLKQINCDQVQGYLYSRPVSMEELSVFLLRNMRKGEVNANHASIVSDAKVARLN